MNARDRIRIEARLKALEEQVNTLTAMLLPADDAPVAEPKPEGGDVEPVDPDEQREVLEAATARPKLPVEGLHDKTGGWFDVYYQGRKINAKALRRDQANALLDDHRQMVARPVASYIEGDPGSAGVEA